MATHTLVANTNSSALTLADGDTIELAGYQLTIDAEPTATGITVQTPATAGTVTISGGYDLSTWSFTAGTTILISTVPSGCVVGTVTGGSANNARGVSTNNGTVTTATGGSANGAHGVANNYSTITTATGGSASGTSGVNSNWSTITTATGGSASTAYGVNVNFSSVTTATGGSASTAYGVSVNHSTVLRAYDDVAPATNEFYGDFKLVVGPEFRSSFTDTRNTITTIYSIGELSPLATIPVGVVVITLSEGGTLTIHPLRYS